MTGVEINQSNGSLQIKGLDRGAVGKIARPSAMLDNVSKMYEKV